MLFTWQERGKNTLTSQYVHEQATLASSYLSERRHLVMLKRRITHFTGPFLILALLALMTGTSNMMGLPVSGRSSQHSLLKHGATTPIQHIVFLIKENRAFDSYFGAFPGVNGTTTGKIRSQDSTSTITLNHLADSAPNYCHEWDCAHSAYDQGRMAYFNHSFGCTMAPYPCYADANANLIPNYWALAVHFVLNDNTFYSMEGASFAKLLYTVSVASC